jgi:arabinogalactan oligomer/maltooligosaccharide transport system permease protein
MTECGNLRIAALYSYLKREEMKAISYIKAILSGLVWGLGQALNRQYLKALFFFIIFIGFVSTELVTSSYFEETSAYSKLIGNDLGDDFYTKSFIPRYLDNVYRLKNAPRNLILEEYLAGDQIDNYIESIGGIQNATIQGIYEIIESSLDRVKEDEILEIIAADLLVNNAFFYKNLANQVKESADVYLNSTKQLIVRRGVIFQDEFGVFYAERDNTNEDGSNQKEFIKTTLLDDQRDESVIIDSVENFFVWTKTNKLYRVDGNFYIQVSINNPETNITSLRYINVLTEELVNSINLTNNEVNIQGVLYIIDNQVFEYYEAGSIYLGQRLQYLETPLTRIFREALYNDYSLMVFPYTNADFNRIMLKLYLNINPNLKETFESQYNNFFYDQAGFFTRSFWSVATLGVADKINYTNHMSLATAVAGRGLSREEFSMFTVPGFTLSENIPLQGHVSTMILLEGLIGLISTFFFFIFVLWSILDAYKTSEKRRKEEKVLNDIDYFKDVYERSFEYIILSPAMFVLAFISIMPILFGFLIAFTSISGDESMLNRFDWVGFKNFVAIFDFSTGLGASFGVAFWRVLGWTIVWAIFSTVTVFFGGFFQALILNSEKVVFRKFWRTLLILPWAIPALLSQMVFSVMFKELGFINAFLQDLGVYDMLYRFGMLGVNFSELSGLRTLLYLGNENIQWFNNPFNPTAVRTALIFINIWLGFPYFMALMTGVMTAIDKTLYEAADIDGASGWQKIRLITMPLVLYSTAPILIMTFSGNFNNFGIIYFVTGGGPNDGKPSLGFAGDTDILISWMYKLTVDYSIYNMASVFSVLIFIFVGSITAWNLSRTRAFQED